MFNPKKDNFGLNNRDVGRPSIFGSSARDSTAFGSSFKKAQGIFNSSFCNSFVSERASNSAIRAFDNELADMREGEDFSDDEEEKDEDNAECELSSNDEDTAGVAMQPMQTETVSLMQQNS